MNSKLVDSQNRRFPYLRMSITDICNFSCQYCLPDGYHCESKESPLSVVEISNLVSAFAELGTEKIRITGGEPSIRKDLKQIIATVANTPNIEQVAITTNGYKLLSNIGDWVDCGLTHLNVSVDTLDPKLFHSLTGHNRLTEILEAIDFALTLSLKQVKLNAVLLKNVNSHQLESYTELLRDKPISMRFIELMRTGDNLDYFNRYHVPASQLVQQLEENGWKQIQKSFTAGPAKEYVHPEYAGRFGVIAPYSRDFCDSCNRLRVSSTGKFHLCLFGEQGYSIRHLLQKPEQKPLLMQALCRILLKKKQKHFLHDGNPGATQNLAFVGG